MIDKNGGTDRKTERLACRDRGRETHRETKTQISRDRENWHQ